MLIHLIRLLLAAAHPTAPVDAIHETAHHVCEVALYSVVQPGVGDDGTTPLGETLAEFLCRNDADVVHGCEQVLADACIDTAKPDGSTDCMPEALRSLARCEGAE